MRSIAVAAMTFPANSIFLWAMDVRPQETFCQECPGACAGNVDVLICAVGMHQLTSPTSVDPILGFS